MSNSTRQGGYDDRLVVPLEASRRGAHRARTNPLVAALPLLVVVIVVAAVIGVAYALFLKPSSETTAGDALTSPTGPGATSAPSATQPSATASKSASASSSSPSSSPAATVNKSLPITVYNGTGIRGLASRVSNALTAAGYSKARFTTSKWRTSPSQTTVFYAKDSQAATAAAVAKALKVAKSEKTSESTDGGLAVVTAADAGPIFP
jgi:hypothetical protein